MERSRVAKLAVASTPVWALAWAALAATPAVAGCNIEQLAALPVTVLDGQPLITAKLAGRETRFIVDSGAFYSMISPATARAFDLHVDPAPPWFRVYGIGGSTSTAFTTVKDLQLAQVHIPKTDFIVGGTDTGHAGLIGRNILGLRDVEYDLKHGIVRLVTATACKGVDLAYWAGTKPYVALPLLGDFNDRVFRPMTSAIVELNGVKLRAEFDTGAHQSMVTLAAAKRAGIAPKALRDGEAVFGIGTGVVQGYTVTFDRLTIGGEAIPRPRLQVVDTKLDDTDMLIGIDFFLSHHVLVANSQRRIYITYEGGPVFGDAMRPARAADGTAFDLADKPPTAAADAATLLRLAGAAMSQHRDADARGFYDRALALAPGDARAWFERAQLRARAKDMRGAIADLDRALALAPGNGDYLVERAQLRLAADDRAGALSDAHAADAALPAPVGARLALASLLTQLGDYPAAAANYTRWLDAHREDVGRAAAFNGRCWANALGNRLLDRALADCNAALRLTANAPGVLDSRALVYLRQGRLDKALADYDAVLAKAPAVAWSRYARSIVLRRLGRIADADAERAKALATDAPKLLRQAKAAGLE